MQRMLFRKKTLCCLFAALVITLLCITVVHNASIRESRGDIDADKDKTLKFLPDIPPDQHDSQQEIDLSDMREEVPSDNAGHAFMPDDVVKDSSEDIKGPLDSEHEKVDLKGVDVRADKGDIAGVENPIKLEEDLKDIRINEENNGVFDEHEKLPEDTALRFEAVPGEDEPEDAVPPETVFGVGEREVKNAKPIPVVKALNKIDAIVDAREKNRQNIEIVEDTLELDDLEPPDHLDAVRMEQDGHINNNYQREVFFGEHEDFENLSEDEMAEKLEEIFKKVDANDNDFITVDELEDWIVQKTNEHFEEARKENLEIFNSLDDNTNGFISWEEFESHFLMALGHKEQDARMYARGKDDDIPLDIEDRERLIRFKFKWADAEKEPVDNQLTVAEFQAFRHPESSAQMLKQMVEDIMDNLDKNLDGIVTEQEFVLLPPGDYDESEMDRTWQKQRSKEFRNAIDSNHDGVVSKQELHNYVDPRNPNHAKLEARNLLELGDSDGDDRLSLDEVIENMDLFYGSKMVNTALSFHDEF